MPPRMPPPMSGGAPMMGSYSNYKTVRCKFFDQGNYLFTSLGKNCPYGDRCSFAHGTEDIRPP